MTPPRIRLIGTPASRVMRNIWMLAELDLPFEHDPIVTTDQRLKAAPYTDWNPNGKVPILVIDGFAIYESLAINHYLDLKFPSALSLTTAEEMGLGMQWSLWALTEVEAHCFNWYLHSTGKPEAERDPAVAAEAWKKLAGPLAVLEKALAATGHLVGDRFTVADLNLAGVMYRALGMPLEAYPATRDWLAKSWSRKGGEAARRARGDLA